VGSPPHVDTTRFDPLRHWEGHQPRSFVAAQRRRSAPCLGAKIRAPPREGSTVPCSDECAHQRASSSVVPPPRLFRRTAAPTRSLLCGRWRCEMKWGLGFGGARPTGSVLFTRRARSAVDRQWTVSNVLGLIQPRWADEMSAQAFAPVCDFQAGWAGPKLSFWADFRLSKSFWKQE
jgi:hypothetical protein